MPTPALGSSQPGLSGGPGASKPRPTLASTRHPPPFFGRSRQGGSCNAMSGAAKASCHEGPHCHSQGSRGPGRGAVCDGAGVGIAGGSGEQIWGVSGGRGSAAQKHLSVPSPRWVLEKVKKMTHMELSSCRLMWEDCDMGTDGSTAPGDTASHPLPRQPPRGMPRDIWGWGHPMGQGLGVAPSMQVHSSRLPDRFSQPHSQDNDAPAPGSRCEKSHVCTVCTAAASPESRSVSKFTGGTGGTGR